MAKERASGQRQGRRDHRRRPGDRQGDGDRRSCAGRAGSRSATSTSSWPSRPRQSSAAARSRCQLDVTDRESFASFLDEAERQLGPLDVLVNNAGIMPLGPVRRGGRRHRAADDRHQPPRRDLRHQAGAGADGAAQQRPHRQHRLAGGQGAASPAAPPTAPPSTPSSASARPSAPSYMETGIEVSCVMPARRQHRARLGPGRGARGQEPRARGGRRGDRRGARDPPLRRLGAALDAGDRHGDEPAAAARPRGDREGAQGRQGARRGRPAARAAYEDRAAHSEPGLEPEAPGAAEKAAGTETAGNGAEPKAAAEKK